MCIINFQTKKMEPGDQATNPATIGEICISSGFAPACMTPLFHGELNIEDVFL